MKHSKRKILSRAGLRVILCVMALMANQSAGASRHQHTVEVDGNNHSREVVFRLPREALSEWAWALRVLAANGWCHEVGTSGGPSGWSKTRDTERVSEFAMASANTPWDAFHPKFKGEIKPCAPGTGGRGGIEVLPWDVNATGSFGYEVVPTEKVICVGTAVTFESLTPDPEGTHTVVVVPSNWDVIGPEEFRRRYESVSSIVFIPPHPGEYTVIGRNAKYTDISATAVLIGGTAQVKNATMMSPASDGSWPYDPVWHDPLWIPSLDGAPASQCATNTDTAKIAYSIEGVPPAELSIIIQRRMLSLLWSDYAQLQIRDEQMAVGQHTVNWEIGSDDVGVYRARIRYVRCDGRQVEVESMAGAIERKHYYTTDTTSIRTRGEYIKTTWDHVLKNTFPNLLNAGAGIAIGTVVKVPWFVALALATLVELDDIVDYGVPGIESDDLVSQFHDGEVWPVEVRVWSSQESGYVHSYSMIPMRPEMVWHKIHHTSITTSPKHPWPVFYWEGALIGSHSYRSDQISNTPYQHMQGLGLRHPRIWHTLQAATFQHNPLEDIR